MDRRSYLTTTGLVTSSVLGGCASNVLPSGEGQDSPTGGSPSPTDAPDVEGVAIDTITVRKAVRYESLMGSGGVLAAEGNQYVIASVRTNQGPEKTDFTFRTDERSWDAGLSGTVGGVNARVAGIEATPVGYYAFGAPRSYLAFVVPSPLSGSNPRIRYESRFPGSGSSEWSLSADLQDRLAAKEPRFELEALDTPERIDVGERLPVTLTIRNASATDGRFLAALYWPTSVADDDESHIVERTIAAADDATATVEIPTENTEGVTRYDDDLTPEAWPVTLSVDGHVTAERDVQVHD